MAGGVGGQAAVAGRHGASGPQGQRGKRNREDLELRPHRLGNLLGRHLQERLLEPDGEAGVGDDEIQSAEAPDRLVHHLVGRAGRHDVLARVDRLGLAEGVEFLPAGSGQIVHREHRQIGPLGRDGLDHLESEAAAAAGQDPGLAL